MGLAVWQKLDDSAISYSPGRVGGLGRDVMASWEVVPSEVDCDHVAQVIVRVCGGEWGDGSR